MYSNTLDEQERCNDERILLYLKPTFQSQNVIVLNDQGEVLAENAEIQIRGHILLRMTPNDMECMIDFHKHQISFSQSYMEVCIHTNGKCVDISIEERVHLNFRFLSKSDAHEFVSVMRKFSNVPDLCSFKPVVTIGKGNFGTVMVCSRDGEMFAIKESVITPKLEKHIFSERMILDQITPCPFILSTISLLRRGRHVYNIMEFCPGGDFYTLISQHPRKIQSNASFYAAEVLLALKHLHQNGILYRDLKPENIMVSSVGHLKLGDFGLAKYIESNTTTTLCGTESYMSPEVLNGKVNGYSYSVDFWQFACLVYELHVGHSPFYKRSGSKNERRKHVREASYNLDDRTPLAAKELIGSIIKVRIEERRYSHPQDWYEMENELFFEGIEWEKIETQQGEPPIIPQETGEENFDISFRRIPARFIDSSDITTESLDYRYAGFDFQLQLSNTWNAAPSS